MSVVGSIAVKGVSKHYQGLNGGRELAILQDVSLSVEPGELIAIIGPSGCGKSTLLSMIAGYTSITKGSIEVGGQTVCRAGPDRVMVFQRPMLFPWLTTADNVAFGLKLRAKRAENPPHRIRTETERLLGLVNLLKFSETYPFQLSGGMQQRVEIARALAVEPQVLLMDEPFGALDAFTRQEMQTEFVRIQTATRSTTLFVTHDIGEALIMADRIVVMQASPGRVAEVLRVEVPREERRHHPALVTMADHLSSLLGAPKECGK